MNPSQEEPECITRARKEFNQNNGVLPLDNIFDLQARGYIVADIVSQFEQEFDTP